MLQRYSRNTYIFENLQNRGIFWRTRINVYSTQSCNNHMLQTGILYGLDRQTFKGVVEEAANKRRQKFRSILSKVSILSQIDPYEREQLCDILKEESYKAGQYVVREGQQGKKFYMIAEGKLIAQKKQKKVFEFKEGDYFGQIALIRNTPRQASVKCITNARVVYINRKAFKRMFGPMEEMLKRNQIKYKQYIGDD